MVTVKDEQPREIGRVPLTSGNKFDYDSLRWNMTCIVEGTLSKGEG